MRALGSGQDALAAGELDRRLEDLGLLDARRAQIPVVIELGEHGAHAVIAQPARVVGRGHEPAAQRVHLGKGGDARRIAEVVGVLAAREGGAACGLDGEEVDVVFAFELLPHEGRDEAAQIGAAARAADDEIGLHAVFIERDLALLPDDGLMQQDVVEHGAQDIAAVGRLSRLFDGFGDGAAQRAARAGMFFQDLPARRRRHGRRRDDVRAVGADDLAAEGLLLVGDLDHIYIEVEPEVGARHRKGGAPLACARLRRDGGEPLLLRVVRLRRRRVELVRARRVVALEFIIDLGGRIEQLFKAVRTHERRGTVHLIEVPDLFGDLDELILIVELLIDALLAEYAAKVLFRAGLARRGVHEGLVPPLHVSFDIIPGTGHLVFREIDLVRDVGVHGVFLLNKKL